MFVLWFTGAPPFAVAKRKSPDFHIEVSFLYLPITEAVTTFTKPVHSNVNIANVIHLFELSLIIIDIISEYFQFLYAFQIQIHSRSSLHFHPHRIRSLFPIPASYKHIAANHLFRMQGWIVKMDRYSK